jgi:hypothetical protein
MNRSTLRPVVLLVATIAGGFSVPTALAQEQKTAPVSAVNITAEKLYQELKADNKAARAKYEGKALEVSGTIATATADGGNGHPSVTLYTTDKPGNLESQLVICQFPDKLEFRVIQLCKDQKAVVRGKLEADQTFGVQLGDCVLVAATRSPALSVTAAALAKEFNGDAKAARQKYAQKPVLLEGVVASIEAKDSYYRFTLAGADGKPAKPMPVRTACTCSFNKGLRDRFAEVKVGQKIRVMGQIWDGYFTEHIDVDNGSLLK